jgi:signal transduction histidine kinase
LPEWPIKGIALHIKPIRTAASVSKLDLPVNPDNSQTAIGDRLAQQWDAVRSSLEAEDKAFLVLRMVILFGGVGWIIFSDISHDTFERVRNLFVYFSVYTSVLFVFFCTLPAHKNRLYGIGLIFDLSFTSVLVSATGGFNSSFFNGFYLITAMYSFHYGLIGGTVIAAAASLLYFASCCYSSFAPHWTDFFIRASFLFLLALHLGMLSQKLKKDKIEIENLNADLQNSIDELGNVQERLIEVEKLSALGRLTADVAHEIRNPLTAMGGFARRLNNRIEKGTTEKEYADIVVMEVDRLERILRDVLTFSRESRQELQYQEVNSIIVESLKSYKLVCSEQSIQTDVYLEEALPDVLIDRDQIRLAVDNLISNALDVMPDGGKLTVRTHMAKMFEVDYVSVEVSDTGAGLPYDSLYSIFEPFYTTKEIGSGTGLGLSICKKIIDEHNGLIFVDSELDKGTTFKMLFPYQSEESSHKIKCWEYMKCGIEKTEGAANMRCPAYPDYGRICWSIAGTFCGKKVSGAIAQKLGNCKKCKFYRQVAVHKSL